MREHTKALYSAVFLLLATAPVAAELLTGIEAEPPAVATNETVTVTVDKSGVPSCTARILYGDGRIQQQFSIDTPGRQFTYAYTQPGYYTVTVQGAGPATSRCNGGDFTATVAVTEGLVARPADPQRTLRPPPPERTAAQPRGPLTRLEPPEIVDHAFVPLEIDGVKQWVEPGVLAPGGRLSLKGRNFGRSGIIRLSNLPGNSTVDLIDLQWSEPRISGRLPDNIGGPLGTRFDVQVTVGNHRNMWSKPSTYRYEVPSQRRRISARDPAVRVIGCGDDGNANVCNQIIITANNCSTWSPTTGTIPSGIRTMPDPAPALFGWHNNCGTIGDDSGTDRYQVHLANGWLIHRVFDQNVVGSSDGESADFSAIPTGVGDATIDVDWLATPNDDIRYSVEIEAIGPLGTEPF